MNNIFEYTSFSEFVSTLTVWYGYRDIRFVPCEGAHWLYTVVARSPVMYSDTLYHSPRTIGVYNASNHLFLDLQAPDV